MADVREQRAILTDYLLSEAAKNASGIPFVAITMAALYDAATDGEREYAHMTPLDRVNTRIDLLRAQRYPTPEENTVFSVVRALATVADKAVKRPRARIDRKIPIYQGASDSMDVPLIYQLTGVAPDPVSVFLSAEGLYPGFGSATPPRDVFITRRLAHTGFVLEESRVVMPENKFSNIINLRAVIPANARMRPPGRPHVAAA